MYSEDESEDEEAEPNLPLISQYMQGRSPQQRQQAEERRRSRAAGESPPVGAEHTAGAGRTAGEPAGERSPAPEQPPADSPLETADPGLLGRTGQHRCGLQWTSSKPMGTCSVQCRV